MSIMERVYAQPHEGITGTDRLGDPLLTEEGSLVASEMMGMLHGAVLVGNPAPSVQRTYERMSNPRVGDAVVVLDSIYMRDRETRNKGVGYLIAVRDEWGDTDEAWAAMLAEDESLTNAERYVERPAWYVQYGPEPVDVCRWSNCQVVAIPRHQPTDSTPGA